MQQGRPHVRPGPILLCEHHYYTLNTCGDRHVARAETLILGGFAGFLAGNGVVFLWMVRWISFPGSGDGDNAREFENEGFVGQKIQSGKTHTIWQKWILSGKRYTLRQNDYKVI